MKKNKALGCSVLLLLVSSAGIAMQPMDDQTLAEATGQDGINIGIGISKVELKQLAVIDRDGLGATVNDAKRAGLVLSGTSASNLNTQSFSVDFLGASNSPTMNVVMDVDGGNMKPFANIGLSFGSNITGIKVSPFAVYLAGANSVSTPTVSKSIFDGTSQKSDVIKILKMENGFDVNFSANKPVINLQLGNVPQSQMMIFGGAIQSICGSGTGCSINVLSDNSDVGAKFDFQLTATDTTNGFSLQGFKLGVESSGLVFGNTGESSKFNVGINNVTIGTSGAVNNSTTGSFIGIQNGSMGNFGAIGTSVTDLKMRVSGL